MKIGMLLSLACMALLIAPAYADMERSALDTKTTTLNWESLKTNVGTTRIHASDLSIRMEKAVACSKKGMVYGPASPTADGFGCVQAAIPVDVQNALNNLTSSSDKTVTTVNNILKCNANGQIYKMSEGKCEGVIPPSHIVFVQASSKETKGNGKFAAYSTVSCPANTTLIACMGAVSPDISASCGGDCGYIGAGPIGNNSCMATVDSGGGAHATVWASCMKFGK